jgi:hypothetical protein
LQRADAVFKEASIEQVPAGVGPDRHLHEYIAAATVVEDTASKVRRRAFDPQLPPRSAGGELRLHGFEQGAVDNGRLLATMSPM